jgi:hypothetical protein
MSAWGGCWGNHTPETGRAVARAFYASKTCKRGNCHTDGERYFLVNTVIARRIREEDIPKYVLQVLQDGCTSRRLLEFSFSGWPTKMTARHLCALGLNASCQGIKYPKPMINGIPVNPSEWYSHEDITTLKPPPPPPDPVLWYPRRVKFVNTTMELFP